MSGYVLICGYVLLSAIFNVWGFKLVRSQPLPLLLVCTFAPVVLLMLAINFRKLSGGFRTAPGTMKHLLQLNLVTAFTWIGAFLALSKLFPAAFSTLAYGLLPLATLPYERFARGKSFRAPEIVGGLLVLFGLAFTIVNELTGSLVVTSIWFGVGAAFFVSISSAAVNVLIKILQDKGMAAGSIFGNRFWLVLAISLIWIIVGNSNQQVSLGALVQMMGLGLIGMALPIYMLQEAIHDVGPTRVGFFDDFGSFSGAFPAVCRRH